MLNSALGSSKLPQTYLQDSQIFQGITASLIPFTVKGVSGQTASLFQVLNSSGTEMFGVDASGNVTINGTVTEIATETGTSLNLSANLAVTGTSTLTGAVTTGAALTVGTTAYFTGDVVANHNLTVNNNLAVAGLVSFTGTVTLGATTFTGAILPSSDDGAAIGASGTAWSDLFLASGAVINFNAGNITLTHSAGVLTLGGGNLALGANSITMSGSIGVTGTRVTKGWFTDLDVTNAIAGSVTGTAATVTGAAQAAITSLGTLTTLTVDDITINGNTISSAGASSLSITPTVGQAILLDGTISIDAGVVTGATSITSTTFVGALTGNADTVTGFTAGAGALTGPASPLTIGTAAASAVGDFATASQGATADSALQNVVEDVTPQLGAALDGQGYDLNNLGVLFLTEQAEAEVDVAGKGQLWVDLATPNVLMFTDDAGTDFTVAHNATTALVSLGTVSTALTGVLRADAGILAVDTDVTDLVDNLSYTKLADGTDGELITWDAAGAPATVAVGTSGHVLTSNGVGAAPTFQVVTVASFTPNLGSLTLSGDDALTLTTSAASNVTLPTTGTLMANLVEDTTPQLGGDLDTNGKNITLSEQSEIKLDPAGSADEKWSGITCTGTAGATLAVGDLVYLDVTATEWLLADADAAATAGDVPLGLCILAANDGQATNLLLQGTMRSAAFPASIALGAPVYAGVTAGDIQATKPSGTDDVVRRVGWAISAEPNTIWFNPSNDYTTAV